jgi:hypothetical protein
MKRRLILPVLPENFGTPFILIGIGKNDQGREQKALEAVGLGLCFAGLVFAPGCP